MPMGKLVFNMSLPLMLSLLVQSLYNIVDSIFVAKISENALAATSLAYPVQILMVAFAVGTGVGVNALLARKIGAKKYEEANLVATTGLLLSVVTAVVFMAVGAGFAEKIAHAFSKDPEIAGQCAVYLRVCMLFCIGMFLETLAQRLLQATGNTFLSMISLVVGAVTNIILDPLMIFGLFGFPALGILGAAIATVIGQIIGAIVALVLNYTRNKQIHFVFSGFRMQGEIVRNIYKVGLPTIVMQAMGSVMVSSVNAILIGFSSTAVAFFGVYYKLQNFLFLPVNGLGQAAIPIAGFNYGAKKGSRIRELLKIDLKIALVIGCAATVVFLAIPEQLLSLFSASGEMKAFGVPALRIICLTFPLASVTTVLGFLVSGLGNGVVNMLGTAVRQVILLVPLAYVFARLGGVEKVWYAMWISEAAAIMLNIICTKQEFSKKVIPLCTVEENHKA